jgi:hypothetical protein
VLLEELKAMRAGGCQLSAKCGQGRIADVGSLHVVRMQAPGSWPLTRFKGLHPLLWGWALPVKIEPCLLMFALTNTLVLSADDISDLLPQ